MRRSRVVAAALTVGLVAGSGSVLSSAAESPSGLGFVAVDQCRLVDTRPAPDGVGDRTGALGPGESVSFEVWGEHGNCAIPDGAGAIAANVTVVEPSASSFLTVWRAGEVRPLAASVNWVAGQGPTSNFVTTELSATGAMSVFNLSGTVHVVIDVVGYYDESLSGGTGEQGPPGPQGPEGPAGADGVPGEPGADGADAPAPANVVWVAKDGTGDYATVNEALEAIGTTLPAATADSPYLIKVGPGVYVESAQIALEPHVSIEGSGAGTTVLRTSVTGLGSAVVYATGNLGEVEVRRLSVEKTGVDWARGVVVENLDGKVTLRDVDVHVDGTGYPEGISIGAYSEVHVIDSHVTATSPDDAYAVAASQVGATAYISGSEVDGPLRVLLTDRVTVTGSSIGNDTVDLVVAFGTVRIIDSVLRSGFSTIDSSDVLCVGSVGGPALEVLGSNCAAI